MAWLAVDKDGTEWIHQHLPEKTNKGWGISWEECVELPKGSIKKLIGHDLSWNNEPVELEES